MQVYAKDKVYNKIKNVFMYNHDTYTEAVKY